MLERLARIEALDRGGAESEALVDELRALLVEAETWSRREGGDEGARAVENLRSALGGPRPRHCAGSPPSRVVQASSLHDA